MPLLELQAAQDKPQIAEKVAEILSKTNEESKKKTENKQFSGPQIHQNIEVFTITGNLVNFNKNDLKVKAKTEINLMPYGSNIADYNETNTQ